jgi:tetratricopeptide (TPR) repeat protein
MGKHGIYIFLFLTPLLFACCMKARDVSANPWLVPYLERQSSTVSRSQMRAMSDLSHIYRDAGMQKEYVAAMVAAIDIYAGDRDVTFELLNYLIDKINTSRADLFSLKHQLENNGVDVFSLSGENLPASDEARALAVEYLNLKDSLNSRYEECYRILRSAAIQIPYDAELYYRVASLQYIRAEDDGDREKYKDAIYYLKRAIACDSGHLESYQLIAMSFERLGDKDRAIRFWQLFEIIYQIAPQVMGEGFVTPQRQRLHQQALQHLNDLGASIES